MCRGMSSVEAGTVVGGHIIKNYGCSRKDFTLYPEVRDSKQDSNIIRFYFWKITLAVVLRWVGPGDRGSQESVRGFWNSGLGERWWGSEQKLEAVRLERTGWILKLFCDQMRQEPSSPWQLLWLPGSQWCHSLRWGAWETAEGLGNGGS